MLRRGSITKKDQKDELPERNELALMYIRVYFELTIGYNHSIQPLATVHVS